MGNNEVSDYGRGWAFSKGGGMPGGAWFLPEENTNLREWTLGYGAALVDSGTSDGFASLEAALRTDGVHGGLLARLLAEAESIKQCYDSGVACKECLDSLNRSCRWPEFPIKDI